MRAARARTRRPARPPRTFRFARFLRVSAGKVLLAAYRVTLLGRENMPSSGGVLLAGNHISYGDPVLLWCRVPRPTHFMAKSELWESRVLAWGLDHVWAFPVNRGQADREAIGRASAYLEAGEPVGIFPEGTRNLEGTAEAQGGAAFLALRAGVPIVPVGIAGTDRIRPAGTRIPRFPKVVISFGTPIDPSSFTEGGRKEKVDAITAEIMRRIAEELARAREVAGR